MEIGDKVKVVLDSDLESMCLSKEDFRVCGRGTIVDEKWNRDEYDVEESIIYIVEMEDSTSSNPIYWDFQESNLTTLEI